MKRSGKTNRAKPSDMSWVQDFPDCARLFLEAGLLNYFEKIDGHHTKVSYNFAQVSNNDIVTFDTLKIELTRELIAEDTDILMKVNIGSRRCLLPLIHRITCFQMLLQTGVKECIYRSSNQSGENQSKLCKAI